MKDALIPGLSTFQHEYQLLCMYVTNLRNVLTIVNVVEKTGMFFVERKME